MTDQFPDQSARGYDDPPPDSKDWTWTLDRPCPECGFAAADVQRQDIAPLVRAAVLRFAGMVDRPDVAVRPRPLVWSPLEYACHVRDALVVFEGRARLMLTQDDPTFDNWDQDDAARSGGYHRQDPALVGPELTAAGAAVATTYDGVRDLAWDRTGRRSNGSEFTVLSLGRYLLHDLYHHLYDVGA